MTRHGEPLAWLLQHVAHSEDSCLPWPYTGTAEGYGRIWHKKRMYPAHRLMCELAHGAPPKETMHAAHSCGNGSEGCMNPTHLRWATKAENEADKIAHGTVMRGSKNAGAKLSEFDVETIREIAPFATQATLCRHYGISSAQVSRIVNGHRWGI
jgi:hypothetical protein